MTTDRRPAVATDSQPAHATEALERRGRLSPRQLPCARGKAEHLRAALESRAARDIADHLVRTGDLLGAPPSLETPAHP